MGTGVKVTQKEIAVTPGPGYYTKTNGMQSETFHSVGRHNLSRDLAPVFSDSRSDLKVTQRSLNEQLDPGSNTQLYFGPPAYHKSTL